MNSLIKRELKGIMLVHAVNHRPRMAGKSNYGVWNRLWVGL